MPDDVVIRFENVSKRYKRTFGGLRHLVQDTADRLLGRTDGNPHEERYLWALKDVSFEVHREEILGIIGLNGAGKSTILKLATRITHPTTGNIEVNGQVGALIEVGAGFHPELTGQENVFLNASILGMSRQEIEEKYESIVAFAELDGFMDMPVKKYSSGMYVRLGFAVAAHLEPEIFLIDEVLAVGDVGFQAKCANKIQELRERDTTIVLVSHNMDSVSTLCDRVILLEDGIILSDSNPFASINTYREKVLNQTKLVQGRTSETVNKDVNIINACTLKDSGEVASVFNTGDNITVKVEYHAKKRVYKPVFGVAIHRSDGLYVYGPNTRFDDVSVDYIDGSGSFSISYYNVPLLAGNYMISVGIFDQDAIGAYDFHSKLYPFQIKNDKRDHGAIYLKHSWQLDESSNLIINS